MNVQYISYQIVFSPNEYKTTFKNIWQKKT